MSLESVQENLNLGVYIHTMPRNAENPFNSASQKVLYSKSLSCTEKGFLAVILGMDKKQPITVKRLKKNLKECPDTIRSYLDRLEKLGFVEKKELVNQKGFFPEYHYIINEFAVSKLSDRTFTDRLKDKKKAEKRGETKTDKESKAKTPEQVVSDRKPSYVLLKEQDNKINDDEKKEENIINISEKISEKQNLDDLLFGLVEHGLAKKSEIEKWKTHHLSSGRLKAVFDHWELIKQSSSEAGYNEQESFHYVKIILNGDGNIPKKVKNKIQQNKEIENKAKKDNILTTWGKVWELLHCKSGDDIKAGKINFVKSIMEITKALNDPLNKTNIDKVLRCVTKQQINDLVTEVFFTDDFKIFRKNDDKLKSITDFQKAAKYIQAILGGI